MFTHLDRGRLVFPAMILAVSMSFIDQTIVAIASPTLQRDLHLTATQGQWTVNAYTVALAATFALGGKLADTLGRRRMALIGVIGFAVCLGPLWSDPLRCACRDLADHCSRGPGRLRRPAGAGRDHHGLRHRLPREAGPLDGRLLRAGRSVHRPRSRRRQLPAELVLARDLLRQRPDRDRRRRAHPPRRHPAEPAAPADRLGRRHLDRRGDGRQRRRLRTVDDLGLDQPHDLGVPGRGCRLPRVVRARRAGGPASPRRPADLLLAWVPRRLRRCSSSPWRRSSRSPTS